MSSNRNPVIEAITNPAKNFLATFLISTILFNLISDGLSGLFWGSFGNWLQTQLRISDKTELQGYIVAGLIVLVLLLIYSTNLAQSFRNLLVKLRIVGTEVPDRARVIELQQTCAGLVVIMSAKQINSPAEVAIQHHWNNGQSPHLQHCWVICTHTSLDYAQKMKQRLVAEGVDENRLQFHYGNYLLNDPDNPGQTLTISDHDAEDPDQVIRLVDSIFVDAAVKGLSASDVIVDFTGGTKPLGVGAFLACASPERRLEYITQTTPPRLVEVQVSYKIRFD